MKAFGLVGLLAVTASLTGAQVATVLVPDEVSCAKCTITLKRVLSIGAVDGKGSLSTEPNGVTVDARGRYWITQEGEMPMVFDAAGKFLQSVGRSGDGPGEFNYPYGPVSIPGDSVVVFDRGRVVVIGPDLRPARTIRSGFEIGSAVVATWPSVTFSWRASWGRDAAQPSVLRVNFAGDAATIINSFGPSDRGDLDPQAPLMQRMGSATKDYVWSRDAGRRYRLSQWNLDGKLLRSLERKPEWFLNPADGSARTMAQPRIMGMREDAAGLVWMTIGVARPGFRDALPNMQGRNEIAARAIPFERLLRTTVEVIDPRTARVVARTILDDYVVAVLPNGRAAAYSVDANGIPHINIVEVTLNRN